MSTWDRCIHWRVCPKPCPPNLNDCREFNKTDHDASWLHASNGLIYCSHCELPNDKKTKYCPNCGAEMGE